MYQKKVVGCQPVPCSYLVGCSGTAVQLVHKFHRVECLDNLPEPEMPLPSTIDSIPQEENKKGYESSGLLRDIPHQGTIGG